MTTPNLETASNPAARTERAGQAVRFSIDPAHSSVGFSVRHMMISNVKGQFERFSGAVHYDPKAPEATVIRASIDATSINTHEEKRDAHLKSADFFAADSFPTTGANAGGL